MSDSKLDYEIKCLNGHLLEEANELITDCQLCDNQHKYPCHRCNGDRCKFSICIKCHNDD